MFNGNYFFGQPEHLFRNFRIKLRFINYSILMNQTGNSVAFKTSVSKKKRTNKISSFLGGVICLLLSATGFYALFTGGEISGGIPLIPDSVNSFIGKGFFLSGSLFTAALAVYAFYELFTSFKDEDKRGS